MRFIDAPIFNWLIAGTDAHAKNYSLLIGAGGRARLAPLYDVASALPYDALDTQRLKLAMKIGGEYRVRDICPRQWHKLAIELRLDPDAVLNRARTLAGMLPDHLANVCRSAKADGLAHPLVVTLEKAVSLRAEHCARMLSLTIVKTIRAHP